MGEKMVKVGVIGYGYWGPNLVRNFMFNPDTNVVCVCDKSTDRLLKAGELYPTVKLTGDASELISDSSIDAVVIATPVRSHFELSMAALKAGKHVFVEKPITTTSDQALQIIEEADRRQLTLIVDHTFVYTGAVRRMRELIKKPSFGNPSYFDSTRINLGLFQNDVNVLWDLAVHDLSIMSYVFDAKPVAVSATGHNHVEGQPENVAFLTVFFDCNLVAHINVSWLSPVKVRKTLIGGTKQMIVYDDLETSEKLKVYDKGITVSDDPDHIHKLLIGYRTGDLWSPRTNDTEALKIEVSHFVNCINGLEKPITGGEEGLGIVRILEAANSSMHRRGAPIDL